MDEPNSVGGSQWQGFRRGQASAAAGLRSELGNHNNQWRTADRGENCLQRVAWRHHDRPERKTQLNTCSQPDPRCKSLLKNRLAAGSRLRAGAGSPVTAWLSVAGLDAALQGWPGFFSSLVSGSSRKPGQSLASVAWLPCRGGLALPAVAGVFCKLTKERIKQAHPGAARNLQAALASVVACTHHRGGRVR